MIRQIRFTFLFYILFSLGNYAVSQHDTLRWHEGIKLKMSDFNLEKGSNYADVKLHYSYNFERGSFGKLTPVISTYVILNRKTSSISDTSSYNLRYAQLLFDLSGYESKLLKAKVMELGELKVSEERLKAKMDSILFLADQQIAQLRKELDRDLKSPNTWESFLNWEDKINNLILHTPDVSLEERLSHWQVGCFIGVGSNFLPGKTGKYFTNAIALNYGFEGDIKRSRFALDVNLGFNKSTEYLKKRDEWQPGTKTNLASIEISYGLKIQKKNWLTVPYLGFSVNEITPRKSNKEDKRKLTGYSPVIGIELNRNFTNRNKYGENVNFFYKTKLSVNPTNFIKDIGGLQVNLRLTIGFDASLVRKKLVWKS